MAADGGSCPYAGLAVKNSPRGVDTITLKGAFAMEQHMYPEVNKELAQKRKELAPEIYAAFRQFGQHVFADGALPPKTKQLIAVAVAHVTQCPYCIRGHTEVAVQGEVLGLL